jgi:hypothetical protein
LLTFSETSWRVAALYPGRVCLMELSLPPSPARLAGLRRTARARRREVASEAADDVVLALNEAATSAILYGRAAGSRFRW